MSVDRVRAFFAERGLDYDIREMDDTTETVEKAARALGVAPELIAKTLALTVEDRSILLVTKGDARIDNGKFKRHFRSKVRMIPLDRVQAATGHPVGGVCPFGLKKEMDIYLDESLRQFTRVYPAAGSRNSCIEIAPHDLCTITGAEWVDVCK